MEKRIKEIIAFGNDRNIKELRRCVGNMDIKDVSMVWHNLLLLYDYLQYLMIS